ncbi:urease-associated protein [Nostoc linckia z16]|nr:urease-associated protein [Nostoc linckia z16]
MNGRLRKTIRYTLRTLVGIIGFVVLYIVAVLLISRITVNEDVADGADVPIYISTNGVHTDIIVPVKTEVKDWSREILFSHTKAGDSLAKYVAFGWGDKGFYLDTPEWSDLKASTAAIAAFHLGTTAMHTRFYTTVKEDADCIRIMVSDDQYKDLVTYIEGSFARNEDSSIRWIEGRSYGNYDAFYDATGAYSLFQTCNTWANGALKAAHRKASLWTVYDQGIFCHYR